MSKTTAIAVIVWIVIFAPYAGFMIWSITEYNNYVSSELEFYRERGLEDVVDLAGFRDFW